MKYIIAPPKSEKFSTHPAIILLHGYGSNENDLFALADYLPPEYLVLSLQAPISLGEESFCWFDIRWGETGFSADHQAVQSAIHLVEDFLLSKEKEFNVDLSQSILFGFSQGAILSYALAVKKPETFKTVIGCSGAWLPYSDTLQEVAPSSYTQHKVLVCHGTADTVLPHSESEKVVNHFKKLGITHHFRSYPIGHSISPQEIKDITDWIEKI